MNQRLLLLVFALFASLVSRGAEAVPTIAVFTERLGLVAPGTDTGPRFLVAVWSDGRIVWSRDQQAGGAPFLNSRVDPMRVEQILKQFEERGVFSNRGLRRSWFGPDSSYHTVWLASGDRHTRIDTWHELFERNPNVVVVNGSVTSLDGRNREEVIRKDTKEFREFRRLWTDLRTAISALIPATGEPFSGPMTFKLPR